MESVLPLSAPVMTRCDPRGTDLSGLTPPSTLSARRLVEVDLVDRGEDFVFLHDQVLHAVELDLLTGVLAEENRVAGLDVQRHALALVVDLAVAHRDHLAALRLLPG